MSGRRFLSWDGTAPLFLYPVLALFAFPTLGHLLYGRRSIAYLLDTFDLPRTGTTTDWPRDGFSLWNPHLTAGNAHFAQQSNTVFGFDVPLEWLIGPFAAYLVFVWVLAAVAGIGMHLFLRDSLGLPAAATVVGATLYLFSFWHYIYGLAGPAIPLLLWLVDRAVDPDRTRWRWVVAAAIAVGVVLYHALSQVVLLVGVVSLLWLVVKAPGRNALPRRVVTWAAVWGLGIGLYSPVVMTQLVMLPLSLRSFWDPALLASADIGEGLDRMADFSALVLPPLGGWLGMSPGRYGTFFAGAAGLVLGVLGIVGRRHDRRTGLLVVLLVAIPAWDAMTVLAQPLMPMLGVLGSFQFDRIRHVIPFAVAAIVALGVDVFLRHLWGEPTRPLGPGARIALLVSLVPSALGLVVGAVRAWSMREGLRDGDEAAMGWLLLAISCACGLALVAAAWLLVRRAAARRAQPAAKIRVQGPRDGEPVSAAAGDPAGEADDDVRTPLAPHPRVPGAVVAALALLFACSCVAFAWAERLTDVPGYHGSWASVLGNTAAKRFLLDQPGIDVDRVLSFGGRPNDLAHTGMLEVGGYESLYPETYHVFFGALIGPALDHDPFHYAYYWGYGNRAITFGGRVDPELVALAGSRWLLVRDDSVPTVPGIVERFRGSGGVVYEVPDVLPRAFVAGGVRRVGAGRPAMVDGLRTSSLEDLRGSVLVADPVQAAALEARVGRSGAGDAGSAAIVAYAPDQVTIDVEATRSGVLVFTDVMAPGWVADVDGNRTPIAVVDSAFRGVPVDAGDHRVVFRYEPGFTYLGFALALASFVAILVLGGVVRWWDRRDAPATSGPP